MNRRDFIATTAGALAVGAFAGSMSSVTAAAPAPAVGAREPVKAAAFHAMRRFAETRFGRIAYVERGTGDAALFLHGFPLNGFQWR